MRIPRKIKKAVKYIERYIRPSASGFWIIPYEEFVVKRTLHKVEAEMHKRSQKRTSKDVA